MQTEQLALPYEEITSVLGRTSIRKKFSISSKESYKIPVGKILIRDGYNRRRVYEDMESLVEWIKQNTKDGIVELDPPLMVDFLDNGKIFILRGHRRFRGILLAIQQGVKIDYVICSPTPKDMKEVDRVADIYSSNMHQSKLKPIEQAEVCFALKNHFDKISNEDIAAKLNVSRQQVDNLLLIAAADDATKQEMINGNLGITEAVKYLRAIKSGKKQSDKVEEDSHKNTAGKTPFPKDELADELKELEELDKQAEELKEEGEERIVDPKEKIHESKPLDLVGNKIAINSKEKGDDDGTVKYDSTRIEIQQVQNCIGLADRLEAIVNKLDVPEGVKKDVTSIVGWLQKDLAECREYIHRNKKQNKIR